LGEISASSILLGVFQKALEGHRKLLFLPGRAEGTVGIGERRGGGGRFCKLWLLGSEVDEGAYD
jgi:hypothetical protein